MADIKKNRRQNYIAKNNIQAIGLMVVFVAALIKWIFMSKQIGAGQNVYLIVFTFLFAIVSIISFTLREVVCKAVAYRKSRGQYKNALRIMKTAALTGFAIGVVFFLILVFAAGRMTNILFSLGAYGTFPLIFLGASIPFLFLWAILLGSFDGFDFSMPDGAAKIIFGITDLLVSVILIFIACNMGKKHAALLHDDQVLNAFGASGAAAGFTIACVFASLWLIVLFKAFRRKMRNNISEDNSRSQESFIDQVAGLGSACGTPFARYLGFFGPLLLNQILFFKFFQWPPHFSSVGFPNTYYAQYILGFFWFALPCGLMELLGKHTEEHLRKAMKKDDVYHSGMYIILNVKQFLCSILPIVVLVSVCLSCLQSVAFGIDVTGEWLYAVVLLLFGLAFLGASMLKGLGKEWLGIIAGLVGFVIQSIAAVFLFSRECYTTERILYCNLIYGIVFLALCVGFLYRFCVYKKQLVNHLGMPLLATFVMLITAVLCMFLKSVIGPVVAIIIAVVVSFAVHMITLIITGCVKENELADFPQGSLLRIIGSIMGIYS